jgi:hypothetical protein
MAPDIGHSYYSSAHLHLIWTGDIERADQFLRDASRSVDQREISDALWGEFFLVRILADISAAIIDPLTLEMSGMTSPSHVGLFYLTKAELSVQRGGEQQAVAYYDSARVSLESVIESMSSRFSLPFLHCYLGMSYAGLGLKKRAIDEGRTGAELMPVSKDAVSGPQLLGLLAEIYAKVGEHEAAIDQLEILLSIPSWVSVPLLRIDPIWDPLRDNPRFQRLLEEHAGSGS